MIEAVKIYDNIPMPPRGNGHTTSITTLIALDIGQSFYWPDHNMSQRHICTTLFNWGKKLDRKFACRKVGAGQIMVWRLR